MNLLEIFKRKKKNLCCRRVTFYLIAILVIVSFGFGISVGYNAKIPPVGLGKIFNRGIQDDYLSRDVDFNLFWQVWDIVKEKYIKGQSIKDSQLFYGSLAGIVASLEDPYSVFLDPKMAQDFSQELSGKFEGIGAEIGIKNKQLLIIAPLPNTPAEKAGLRTQDKILAIDEKDTRGMPLDLAVQLIRGERGTHVVLTIMRDDFDEPREFKITRDVITVETVISKMISSNVAGESAPVEEKNNDIGYIKISHFNNTTAKEFKKAVDKVLRNYPRGLILDLRNNPGGYFDMAVEIASYWVEKDKLVVYEKFSDDRKLEYKSLGRQPFLGDYKTIVLVNQGSASASEITAGALQDYGLATILGEKTFGKGSVQELDVLSDGSAIKLTLANWLTPKEKIIDEVGITPDVEIELTLDDFNNNKDPQLDKAVELLSQLTTNN